MKQEKRSTAATKRTYVFTAARPTETQRRLSAACSEVVRDPVNDKKRQQFLDELDTYVSAMDAKANGKAAEARRGHPKVTALLERLRKERTEDTTGSEIGEN